MAATAAPKAAGKSTRAAVAAGVPAAYYKAGKPAFASFGPIRYLSLRGVGEPGGEAFQAAIQAIYPVAYTLKFAEKAEGRDFKVGALEARWWTASGDRIPDEGPADAASWRWEVLIAVPAGVSEAAFLAARDAAAAKKKGARCAEVQLITLDEGEVVQALHTGPYDREWDTIRGMVALMEQAGRQPAGRHHEIYLNDPRRVGPERTKTILRQPVG